MYSHWVLKTVGYTGIVRDLNLISSSVQIQTLGVHTFASIHLEVVPWSLLPGYLLGGMP
jgi:hypothetical protein